MSAIPSVRCSPRRGFTLIELVITIVVLGVSLLGVLSVFTNVVQRSADPVVAQQGIAVAAAYLEEILAKSFPDGSAVCAARASYESPECYFGLVEAPTRSSGTPISGLSAYTVEVAGGPCGLGLGGNEQRVDVRVSHPNGFSYQISGCMTNHR